MSESLFVSPASAPRVPNALPQTFAAVKVGFLGDIPTKDDLEAGIPFTGSAGQLLQQVMNNAGLIRSMCFLGNACQFVTTDGQRFFTPHGSEYAESRKQLTADLLTFRPNVMVLLGQKAFAAAGFGDKKVSDWRGSVLQCSEVGNPLFGMKCIPTYHPSEVIRMWEWLPLFTFDIMRAAKHGGDPLLNLPERNITVAHHVGDVVMLLRRYREEAKLTALDIEGWVNNVSCISFSNSPSEGFTIPLVDFSPKDLAIILREMEAFLTDPRVPKVLQNGLYDATVLAQTYGILIRNFVHDTMLSGWEIYSELPKSLGVQTSIWTEEPFYKFERKTDDKQIHYRYCAKDSMVTLEISQKQQAAMSPSAHNHYRFNVNLLRPVLYAQLRGMKYDIERANLLHSQTTIRLGEVRDRLRQHSKNPNFNPGSHVQVKKLLYDQMRFPKQMNKKDKTKVASDVPAILNLLKDYQQPVLVDLLLYSKLDKEREYLEVKYDTDGRMRCSYNVVGTETGRLSCSKAANGVGTNLTTIPKKFRSLFLADDGMEFFQCDLEGADGWTVAAHCKAYGDPRMMDDYLFGLKPAKIIALMFLRDVYTANADAARKNFTAITPLEVFFKANPLDINDWTRDNIKLAAKFITEEGPDGWLYFTCKRCQHATNYGTGTTTMKQQVLNDSYKVLGNPVVVQTKDCKILQDLYYRRYPGVKFWQDASQYKLKNARGFPEIEDSSGHVRRFFGRKSDHETFRSLLSHEPQANTTYVTNCAIRNLWNDRSNRNGSRLIIEPLHQVHDALCGQWPVERREWAIARIFSYFDNPIEIAGSKLVIPYDGGFGRSWGEAKQPMTLT